jgi:uncharacterized protein
MQELIAKTIEYVKEYHTRYDGSHDWSHIQRVLNLAHKIEGEERKLHPDLELDSDLITLAALLHDVGDRKYLTHEEMGNADSMASSFLVQCGADLTVADKVQLICTNVSWTNESKNLNSVQVLATVIPELAIVQDADRLDGIGAVGIARLFTFSGAHSKERGLSTEHFHVKLLRVRDRMKTLTGKKLAEERTERMKTFLYWWDDENTGVPTSAPPSAPVSPFVDRSAS